MVTYFELHRPTLATMTVRTTGDIGGIYALDGPAGIVSGTVDGIPGTARTTSLLEPGFYQLTGDFDLGLTSPVASGDPTSSAGTANLAAAFVVAGAATGPSSGPGAAIVALPGARRCGTRSLVATLRSRASRIDRIVVSVNGRRRTVVETPTAGRRIELRSLPPTRAVTVRAVLDPKQGRATTVTRRYAACSA